MNGKVIAMILLASGLVAGGLMYYMQVYGFYDTVEAHGVEDVKLTTLNGGFPEPILSENFKGIDAESSPIRYRACFDTPMSQAMLSETYVAYDDPVPLTAPGWFDCFEAESIGAALASGEALAFLGTANIVYGIDRVVAVDSHGHGYVWHQINACGREVFDGNPPPEGCPPPPERTE